MRSYPLQMWPIIDHRPIREASANQEAPQSPIPPLTPQFEPIRTYFLMTSSTMNDALFIGSLFNDVSIIYVDNLPSSCELIELVLLCFRRRRM